MVGVIIQAVTGLDGLSWCVQQIDACHNNGLRVQGYVYCWPNSSKQSLLSRLHMFASSGIEALWLDVEQDGLRIPDVERDLQICDGYMGGQPTGIYTGRWFWVRQGWMNNRRWCDRPLWDSNYDGVTNVDTAFTPYGGWTQCAIKQYRGTSAIGPVHQIDLDVMR